MHYRAAAPVEFQNHFASMPNAVDGLYCTFALRFLPFIKWEVEMEAWGQLCFDSAACGVASQYMKNNKMTSYAKFVSWRVEMSGPLVGGAKMSGKAPVDFVQKYLNGNDW